MNKRFNETEAMAEIWQKDVNEKIRRARYLKNMIPEITEATEAFPGKNEKGDNIMRGAVNGLFSMRGEYENELRNISMKIVYQRI